MSVFEPIPEDKTFPFRGGRLPAVLEGKGGPDRVFVAGNMFGPQLVVFASSYDKASDLSHEHGVGVEDEVDLSDLALPDYGKTLEEQHENALLCGDMIHHGSIGYWWVDYTAWMIEIWDLM